MNNIALAMSPEYSNCAKVLLLRWEFALFVGLPSGAFDPHYTLHSVYSRASLVFVSLSRVNVARLAAGNAVKRRRGKRVKKEEFDLGS